MSVLVIRYAADSSKVEDAPILCQVVLPGGLPLRIVQEHMALALEVCGLSLLGEAMRGKPAEAPAPSVSGEDTSSPVPGTWSDRMTADWEKVLGSLGGTDPY